MIASLEVLGGILRVHPQGVAGGPWTWACHIQINGNKGTLRGASRAPTVEEARALKALLLERGIEVVRWERRNVANPRETQLSARRHDDKSAHP